MHGCQVRGLILFLPHVAACDRSQPSGARNQAQALEAEGVTVGRSAMGELTVDFAEHGWFPTSLPSAGSDAEDDEDDDEEAGDGE